MKHDKNEAYIITCDNVYMKLDVYDNYMNIYNYNVKYINIPEGIENVIMVGINFNGELVLPSTVHSLQCQKNKINKIILPLGMKYLDCQFNNLTELKLPFGLTNLYCRGNKIKELDIPTTLLKGNFDKSVKGLEKITHLSINLF